MEKRIIVWSQDYQTQLFETSDIEAAKQYLRNSDQSWLPVRIDYGKSWKQRWCGRLERKDDVVEVNSEYGYLKHMLTWPSIEETSHAE